MKFERSKYNGDQILGFVFDEEKQSLSTSMDAEFAVELSHEDGDSVLSVLPSLDLQGNQEKSCIGIKNVVLYVMSGSAQVMVSPTEEGDVFFLLTEKKEAGMSEIKHICAKRIKLIVSDDSEAYVCGQG